MQSIADMAGSFSLDRAAVKTVTMVPYDHPMGWDERWAAAADDDRPPQALLLGEQDRLPTTGRAIDVAGGLGSDALWLAELGLDVTLVDGSTVACERASARAARRHVSLTTLVIDLETAPVPAGPWDIVHIANYLHRPAIADAVAQLAVGGVLVMTIATVVNRERNENPAPRFLVEAGELADLARAAAEAAGHELRVERDDADWRSNGRHESWLVARRT